MMAGRSGVRRLPTAAGPEGPTWPTESPVRVERVRGSLRLDPAGHVLLADRLQEGRVVGGQVPANYPDHLVIAVAAGHEPAFAPDHLHLAPPALAGRFSVMPGC